MEVSIIIPVYNTEQYLVGCLDSVLKQTFLDFDVILIDDGSTDNSLNIIKAYCRKNENFRFIQQANSGQGDARNKGVSLVNSNYIVFLDSDDRIHKEYLALLYQNINQEKSDFSCCRLTFEDDKQNIISSTLNFTKKKLLGEDIFVDALLTKNILSSPVNKIYRAKLLKDNPVEFPSGVINEDVYFCKMVSYYSKKVSFVNIPLYFALVRSGSTTRGDSAKSIKDMLFLLEKEEKFLVSINASQILFNAHKAGYVKALLWLSVRAIARGTYSLESRQLLSNSYFDEYLREAFKLLPIKYRVLIILYKFKTLSIIKAFKKHLS
jgi:glycosyltransferase involved in cell wall biosynthesis